MCMQDNSLCYAVFCYEWILKGKWDFKHKNEDSEEEEDSDY